MRFGDKLKKVVLDNFIEISRSDVNGSEAAPGGADADTYANTGDSHAPAPAEPNAAFAATAAATADSVEEPIPVAQTPPAPRRTTFQAVNFPSSEVLTETGKVDFGRVYDLAQLPPVTFTAEQAADILGTIPADLPFRVKRLAVRATLDSLARSQGAESTASASENIASDAAQKMFHVARLQEGLSSSVNALRERTENEIAAMEAEIAERRAVLERLEAQTTMALGDCRTRINQLNDVVLFFDDSDTNTTTPPAETAEGDEEELPPFMRADNVNKLLGLKEGAIGEPNPVA